MRRPAIADKDIECYKVVTISSMRRHTYKSYWKRFNYALGETYTEPAFKRDLKEQRYVLLPFRHYCNNGFHSYADMQHSYVHDAGEALIKCIIPKGTLYYKSWDGNEYCSEKITLVAQAIHCFGNNVRWFTKKKTEESKSIVVFDDNPCAEWLSRETYIECNDIPDDEFEDDAYYEWVNCCLQSSWDDFKSAVKKHLDDTVCIISGTLGLWNSRPEITPKICNSVIDAIKKCLDIRGDHFETIAIEEDGSLSVNVYHHDGCNSFSIRKVSAESESLALYIEQFGEDDESKLSDIKYEAFAQEEFEL